MARWRSSRWEGRQAEGILKEWPGGLLQFGTYGAPVYKFFSQAKAESTEDQSDEPDIPIRSRVLVEDVDRDGVDEVLVIATITPSPSRRAWAFRRGKSRAWYGMAAD